MPERSYRRWQQRQRDGRPVKGPWPTPSADRIEPTALAYADRYPQWGSKTIAMLMRADGHYGPNATVYRALKRTGRTELFTSQDRPELKSTGYVLGQWPTKKPKSSPPRPFGAIDGRSTATSSGGLGTKPTPRI